MDLKQNKIQRLPLSFGRLNKLLKLDLSENSLVIIPDCIQNLTTLADLNLSKNKINQIEGDSFGNLTNLVILDLHQNQLAYFGSVPRSQKLDTINLAFNQLQQVENLENAGESLTVLDFHNNKLTELP